MNKVFFLLGVSLLFLGACNKERPKVYNVPGLIEPYVQSFVAEANARGIDLVVDDLVVEYGENLELNGTNAAGLCHYETNDVGPRIQLDTTSQNWSIHPYSRELLIFHELGHCVLNLNHDNTLLANGGFKTLMKASGEPIFAGFNEFKREYYLDYLFNTETAEPDWATAVSYDDVVDITPTFILKEDFEGFLSAPWDEGQVSNGIYNLTTETSLQSTLTKTINTERDFEIETRFQVVEGPSFASCLTWGGNGGAFGSTPKYYQFGYNINKDCIIFNRNTNDYVSVPSNKIDATGFNKLTIRKQGDMMYFFINEQFHDLISFQEFYGNRLGFLVQDGAVMQVDYLYAYYLD